MIRVLACGPLATLQDAGRTGHLRSGVPVGGPVDPFAFTAALALAGCADDACAIELPSLPFTFTLEDRRVVAVAGPGVSLRADAAVPGWTAAVVRAGRPVTVIGDATTRFAYLAVAGGITVAPWLGSRATHLGFALGSIPRPLRAGDLLPLGKAASASRAGRALEPASYAGAVRAIRGPHTDRFDAATLHSFYSSEFAVEPSSDRTGTRLAGPRLAAAGSGEIRSAGMVAGAVQVPPGGAPIVLLADHQTTGGYPVIATVIAADLGRVAQASPGDRIRFAEVDRDEAVRALAAQRAAVEAVR